VISQPKKTKEDRAKEKASRKKAKKPKSKLQKKKDRKNSAYWMIRADKLFMSQAHGKPCEICQSEEGTVFHHVIAKSTCKALRYDLNNMVILCPQHHNFSNEIAAHSTNAYAQQSFMKWFEDQFPFKYEYCKEHQHNRTSFNYKDVYEKFVELKEQGLPIERKVND
jgi:hypothetical protein